MASYGEMKRAVLELINQASIAGEDVPPSYNNQADYLRRIPGLLNHAVMKIRTTLKPDIRWAELTDGEPRRGGVLYPLPSDCRALVSGGVWASGGNQAGPLRRTNDYRLIGRSVLLPAPDCAMGSADTSAGENPSSSGEKPSSSGYLIEYQAYPVQLPADPEDGYELEETPEVLQAAAYYAAAMLIMMEDEFCYANLMNEYESRLASMSPPTAAEVHPVRDAYGFGGAAG